MKKLIFYLILLFSVPSGMQAQSIFTVGTTSGDFSTLFEAFDYINAGAVNGDIILEIIENTDEIYGTAILNASGSNGGLCDYSSVMIYPSVSSCTISGSFNAPLIDLNGADNVTIDGRVNQTGAADLTIVNTWVGGGGSYTIRFIESAESNLLQYCIIKGSVLNASGGVIFFSTATAGNGNDNNIIDNNYFTGNGANRPVNVIYSSGTSGYENSGNIISNNNFYDFMSKISFSSGIFLSGATTSWTISGNSFYESAPLIQSSTVTSYNIIQIINSNGTGFIVSGNYIGGSSPLCGGNAWTKNNSSNNAFIGINMSVGTGTASNIQNNIIQNFDWINSLSASWTGIQVSGGTVNIGSTNGNTIGASSGTNSVLITEGATNANVYGINITSSGTTICDNNNIGSITAANSSAVAATNFTGIYLSGSGTFSVNNNIIGSTLTASSIYSSSASTGVTAQGVFGINNIGTGTITLNNNTIANLTNGTTNLNTLRLGTINGIKTNAGAITISNNTIHDLNIGNANNSALVTSVCGMALSGNTLPKTVTGNTIYNLSNSFASFAGSVVGINFLGNTGVNVVNGNYIHSLFVTGISSVNASIYGIKVSNGTTTYSNNIISLGGNTTTNIYGIYETGAASNNNNLYFNTVYIGGRPGSGSNMSYALYSAVTTNERNFRNNILSNVRSTTNGSNLHYAIYFAATGGTLTCDFNDYYVSGTGGILGFYGNNKTALPVVTDQDANSYAIDPVFAYPGSTTATDYKIGQVLMGISGTGITADYESTTRINPTLGAFELPVNKWKGNTNTAWDLPTNWTVNVPVGNNINIVFDDAPLNDCYLDADHSVVNITNKSSHLLVIDGHKLTIKGNLDLGSYKIDASATGSTVEFAGTVTQSIPPLAFLNYQIYNLIVNNANNVSLGGDLNLLNSITATSGRLDATMSGTQIMYIGTSTQTIEANCFLNERINSLTISNTTGVLLNSDFIVDRLQLNTNAQLTIAAGKLLIVPGDFYSSGGNTLLIIKSDAYGNDGKLINNSGNGARGSVELYLTGGLVSPSVGRFHYFAPPVASMYIGTSIAEFRTRLSVTNFNGDLLAYDETKATPSKESGWQYFDGYGSTTGFSSIPSTMGYNIYLTADDKITITGILNGTVHNFNLNYTSSNPAPGWNLVGNPYPCNYRLHGIPELITTDNVDNTVYFNHDGGYGYRNVKDSTYVGSIAYSDIIAPMQGFFVHVSAAASITLPVDHKTPTSADPLRSKGTGSGKANSIKKIKLALNKGLAVDETLVCLIDDATKGFDGDHDAYKLFGSGNSTSFIYTELNAIKYAINAVRAPESGTIIIPVTVEIKSSGTYTIDVSEFENLEGTNVILKHGSVETNLSLGASYTFTSGVGTFKDFELIIGNNPTGFDETFPGEKLETWYSQDYLYINIPDDFSQGKGSFIIYDIQGKMVYNKNLMEITPGQTIQIPLNLAKGVYVIRVIANNQPFVSKIIVF